MSTFEKHRIKAKDQVRQAVRVFKAFTLKLPDGYEVGMDVDAIRGRADSGILSEDLCDLFAALGEAARGRKTGVVLLLDEIQFLKRQDLEALIAGAHHVAQRNLPVAIVGSRSAPITSASRGGQIVRRAAV